MATQSYQPRSDSHAPRALAPNLARPFVVPTQTPEENPQVQAAPDQGASLLNNRYQVSATPNYQPTWIARAQTLAETAEPEETEEKVEETAQRSIDGAPPEPPSDPADDPEGTPVQTKLTVGQPNDRYEQEADRVAEQVMSMPDTAVQRQVEDSEETEIQAKPIAGINRLVQRKAAGPTKVASGLEAQLNGSKGQGSALPDDVRSFMEPRFGVDFGQVRVHTDGNAVQMNKSLGAKAFAHGSDVYYGAGNIPGNDALTAHELTHVVQQTGGGVRKNSLPKSSGGAMQPKAIANDVKRFKRGGEIQAKVLPEQAIVQQTEAIGGKTVHCKTLVTNYAEPQLQGNWFGDRWDDVKSGAKAVKDGVGNLAEGAVNKIREKLLGPVAQLFTKIPGYSLLTLALGKDPVSGAKVERNATNLVQAVLSVIPGGDKIFKNLQESKGLEKTFTWLNQQVTKLNLTWDVIKNLFKRTWDSLSAGDLVNPAGAFEKVKNVFAEPIGRIVKFASSVGQKVLEFVLEGAMSAAGSGASKVMEVLKKMGASFMTVVKDPIGFVNNLVKAVKGGFSQFMANIGTHLKNGLMGWLTGAMAGGGIKMPAKFDLQGITSLVLQVLGITYAKIRAILVKRLGEKRVATLEKTSKYVQMLVTQGIDGMMDKMVEFLGDLKDTIVTGIQNWVIDTVIKTAIPKLLSMFTPAGAIVQAALSIYNTIMFFIEKAEQIAALVQSVLDSLANIASGAVDAAIGFIEKSMAKAVPLVINFLARWLGLGNVSAKIRGIIQKVQAKVDAALEKVADWIDKMAGGGKDVAVPAGASVSTPKAPGLPSPTSQTPATPNERNNLSDTAKPTNSTNQAVQSVRVPNNPKEHENLAKQAIVELERQEGEDDDYETLRAKKLTQAKQIEQTYSKKLQPGIQLTVLFEEASKDQQDNDLDFRVKIAPNDTVLPGSTKFNDNLKKAVESVGIVEFMKSMAKGTTIMGINRSKLEKLWKNQNNKDWLKSKFRLANKGNHEWIPSNMIMDVVNRTAGVEDGVEVADWIELQHNLRTDTSWVIFNPSKGSIEKHEGKDYTVLHGHIGAVYLKGEQKTKGANVFHGALRSSFVASQKINQCIESLQAVFKEWVWDGKENPSPSIHPLLEWNGVKIVDDLSGVKSRQSSNYQSSKEMFNSCMSKP
jgi:Domain of unknown function (DUF4157)